MGPKRTRSVRDPNEDWRMKAACVGLDPDMFFPGHDDREGIKKAVAVCMECPVVTECDAYATRHARINGYRLDGIWGGRPRWVKR